MIVLILIAQTYIPISPDSVVIVRHDEPPASQATSLPASRKAARFFRAPKPGPSYRIGELVRGELVDGEKVTPQQRYWTGKKWSTKAPPARLVYNVWRTRANWSFPGPRTRQNLIDHLMGRVGERGHVGKFEEAKLWTLRYSQLDNLHSNDHEGRPYTIRGRSVDRKNEMPTGVTVQESGRTANRGGTPPFCPT